MRKLDSLGGTPESRVGTKHAEGCDLIYDTCLRVTCTIEEIGRQRLQVLVPCEARHYCRVAGFH